MQTYSHILVAAGLSQPLAYWISSKNLPIPKIKLSAIVFGSLLPDLALILITIVCLIRDKMVGVLNSTAWENHDYNATASPELLNASWTASLFDDWFFNNPIVITLQNTFHSPLLLIIFIYATYCLWKKTSEHNPFETSTSRTRKPYQWLFWMCCAAMLHTMIDIPLHADDGPLIAFPINWDYRFNSVLSYWDPNHHGRSWSIFEHALDALIMIYLSWVFFSKKGRKRT